MQLRYVDAQRPAGPLRRAVAWLSTLRPVLFFTRLVSWKLDPVLLRITGGRLATTLVVPTAVLETRGARTRERRRHAVIYWHDGDRVIIAASHGGRPRNPAWYHNLVADPEVLFGNERMRAEEVREPAEQDRLWKMGDRVFPAYASYRRRAAAAGRTIPLLRLTPA